ncbi:MFS transporter [Acidimangrovimonas sediminis]|uniref:MFS transporter n=1 Tax=Acidimangrovimonas sediminis TaxID=2056283 RepID=UPI000C802F59|nr:MFS transporter [Acidimangrovimonas sediminis]
MSDTASSPDTNGTRDDGLACAVFDRVAGESETDDLAPGIRAQEPANFLRHVSALSLTKAADGLIDPKLVLSWLLTQGGAGAGFVGFLVPIREAGALLPQLFVTDRIRRMARRKWAWAGGSAVQGLAAAAIGLAGFMLSGPALGYAILGALAVLAVARSVCSASYKDVLGRTVAKGRRGTASGIAGSVAAGAVLIFALVLLSGLAPRRGVVLVALALAALFWLGGGTLMSRMAEPSEPAKAQGGGVRAALGQLHHLRDDWRLRRFVLARGLLTATALSPPYIVLMAGEGARGALGGELGAMVLASSLAALVSSYVWGRLSDRSSRWVLMLAGVMGAAGMGLALGFGAAGLMGTVWAPAAALFVLNLAHQGVRIGRSTYLVDMAREDLRAPYTSVGNTVIGVILLASGAFGALAAAWGAEATLALFAAMAIAAALVARGLPEA